MYTTRTLAADSALVQLAQALARRGGVSPLDLDVVMLNPSHDILARFPELARFPQELLKSR